MQRCGISFQINSALLLTILMALAFLFTLSARADNARLTTAESVQSLMTQQLVAREIQVNFKKQVQEWKNILIRGHDSADLSKFETGFLKMQSLVTSQINSLISEPLPDDAAVLLRRILADLNILGTDYQAALALFKTSGDNGYQLADAMVRGKDREPTDLMDELVERLNFYVSSAIQAQQDDAQNEQRWIVVAAAVFLLAFACAFAFYLSRWLVKPLRKLAESARQMSDDDYSLAIPYTERKDAIGSLACALQVFRRNRISAMALQRSAMLSIEAEEKEKLQALQTELEAERSSSLMLSKQHDQDLADASRGREQQLTDRIQRLSKAVAAAASGNLQYLAAHPEAGEAHADDLAHMTGDLESLFGQFDQDFIRISGEAATLSSAAASLGMLSESIKSGAQLNTEQSRQVLAASSTVRKAIIKMSEDISVMATGIGTIESSAAQASVVANEAVNLGQQTDTTMRKLSTSSADIGNVIKLINSVAEQTNLLALNATIEAARAGDAGKGFAVVANEVKELAKETNKATMEIQRRIDAIRGDTDQAVDAIGNINTIVSQINEIQLGISESVKEQSHSAECIMQMVSSTLAGNKEVIGLITEVTDRQSGAEASANEIHSASEQLKRSAAGTLELTSRYVRSH